MLESDPDWVPSLHMGHSDEKNRRTERLSSSKMNKKQRWPTEARQADVFNAEMQREPEAAEGGTEVFTLQQWMKCLNCEGENWYRLNPHSDYMYFPG